MLQVEFRFGAVEKQKWTLVLILSGSGLGLRKMRTGPNRTAAILTLTRTCKYPTHTGHRIALPQATRNNA